MGYWELSEKEQEKEDLDMLKIRVENTIGKKVDRAVEKELITKEDADKLTNALSKFTNKGNYKWWAEQKGNKSFDIAVAIFEDKPELEILMKIEKA